MDELEQLKQQRLAQRQQRLNQHVQQQAQEQAELQQQLQMLEAAVKQHLTKEALERYGNIKSADEKKAMQICVLLGHVINEQGVRTITDEQLKVVLQQLTPQKRETKITFK